MNYLIHSAKGTHWVSTDHKYLRKEGNKYIYPEDVAPIKATLKGPKNNYGVRATEQDARLKAEQKTAVQRAGYNPNKTATPTRSATAGATYVPKESKKKGPTEEKKAYLEQNKKKKEEEAAKQNSSSEVTTKEEVKTANNTNVNPSQQNSSSNKSSNSKSSGSKKANSVSSKESTDALLSSKRASDMSDDELDQMALSVIRGNYGNGQARIDALGDNYSIIQQRVNEIIRGTSATANQSTVAKPAVSSAPTTRPVSEYADTGSNKSGNGRSQSEKYPELSSRFLALGMDINKMTDFQIEQLKNDLSKYFKHSSIERIRMEENYLVHHGIKGQKWGVRRFQNADGSLTSTGRKRYGHNADGTLTTRERKKRKTAVGVGLGVGLAKGALVGGSLLALSKITKSTGMDADAFLNLGGTSLKAMAKVGAIKAGKSAVTSSLLVYGGMSAHDAIKNRKNKSKNE